MSYLEKLIKLGEKARQSGYRVHDAYPKGNVADLYLDNGDPVDVLKADAAYIASLSPHKLLPLLRAAKEMRDVVAGTMPERYANVLEAFDAAVAE